MHINLEGDSSLLNVGHLAGRNSGSFFFFFFFIGTNSIGSEIDASQTLV